MYYSLLFKCLIGVFNYNIFNMRVKFKATLESFEPFGLLIVWINMASDKEKVPKGKCTGERPVVSDSVKNPELS